MQKKGNFIALLPGLSYVLVDMPRSLLVYSTQLYYISCRYILHVGNSVAVSSSPHVHQTERDVYETTYICRTELKKKLSIPTTYLPVMNSIISSLC